MDKKSQKKIMKMSVSIPIVEIEVIVRLAMGRSDDILAFGELWAFEKDNQKPVFKVKGFTIKLRRFKPDSDETITVKFPAFKSIKSKTGYQTSFIFENAERFHAVVKMFLDEYNQVSGGITPEERRAFTNEDIDPDDIPF